MISIRPGVLTITSMAKLSEIDNASFVHVLLSVGIEVIFSKKSEAV